MFFFGPKVLACLDYWRQSLKLGMVLSAGLSLDLPTGLTWP